MIFDRSKKRAMNLRVDRKADALYLRLDDSLIVESEEVSTGVVLDYNESNEVVGVEMLHTTLSEGGTSMKLREQGHGPSLLSGDEGRGSCYCGTDSLYIEFKARPGAETIEVTEGLNVDIDTDGEVVGFDIDQASRRMDLSTLETEALPLHSIKAG